MIKKLFIKSGKGEPMQEVPSLVLDANGIAGQTSCLPLRQVLIVPTDTLDAFGIGAADLRGNILVEWKGLHDLPSGSILNFGGVRIHLTFHCESCDQLRPMVEPKKIAHRRGFLGRVLTPGTLHSGDKFNVEELKLEEIPFNPTDRISWYLRRNSGKVMATLLLAEIGFSRSYARVLPRWLQGVPEELKSRVVWASKKPKANI